MSRRWGKHLTLSTAVKGNCVTTTVLGANGKLGKILCHYARSAGLRWTGQARDATCDVQWSARFDEPAAAQLFEPGATVINMIGQTGSDAQTLRRINVDFVETLLEHATRRQVAHIVLASTAAVYGPGLGLREGDALEPIGTSAYALSKIEMETAARDAAGAKGAPKVTVLRIGNVAGADGLLASAAGHVADGTTLKMDQFEDGTAPVRSYISPRELFGAVQAVAAVPKERFRIINVAHPDAIELSDLVEAYRSHLLPKLDWQYAPATAHALRHVALDVSTLQEHLSFSTMTAQSLAQDVARYWDESS